MKRILMSSLAVLGLLGAVSQSRAQSGMPPGALQPQFGGNIYQPTLSPYLQLLRGGAPPGVNYFNLTVPQQQFYGGINQLQQGLTGLGQQVIGGYQVGGSTEIMPTGHMVGFGNYMWYYGMTNRMLGRGYGSGGMGGMGGMGGGMGGMGGMGMGMGMGMGGMGGGLGGFGMMGMGGMGMGGMGMMGMGMGMGGMGGAANMMNLGGNRSMPMPNVR